MVARRHILVSLIAALAAPAWADEGTAFAVGQVWTLRPPMHADARIRVGRIEGDTVHISLWGEPIDAGGPLASPLVAGHLPITAAALRASVDRLADDAPPEGLDFEGGYNVWRQDQGGVFALTVPQIVEVMLQTIRGRQVSTK